MSDIFSKADTLFTKIAEDETGRLRKLVNQIIQSTKAATDLGCTPEELQMLYIIGLTVSKEPETRELFDLLLKTPRPSDDEFH